MRRLSMLVLPCALLALPPLLGAQPGAPPAWPEAVGVRRSVADAARAAPRRSADEADAQARARVRRFALAGSLVGGVGGFALCNGQRPPGLTREGRGAVAVACGALGALLGLGVGVGLAAASDPDREWGRGRLDSLPPRRQR